MSGKQQKYDITQAYKDRISHIELLQRQAAGGSSKSADNEKEIKDWLSWLSVEKDLYPQVAEELKQKRSEEPWYARRLKNVFVPLTPASAQVIKETRRRMLENHDNEKPSGQPISTNMQSLEFTHAERFIWQATV